MLVPMMHERLQNALDKGRTWRISCFSASLFEVHCEPSMFINIGQRICKCGKWQAHGFPCPHAVAVLTKNNHMSGEGIMDYIKPYFFTSYYDIAVLEPIHPIVTFGRNVNVTPEVVILPPITRKLPSRPKKKRIPSNGENMRGVKGNRCGEKKRHNRKSCREVKKN